MKLWLKSLITLTSIAAVTTATVLGIKYFNENNTRSHGETYNTQYNLNNALKLNESTKIDAHFINPGTVETLSIGAYDTKTDTVMVNGTAVPYEQFRANYIEKNGVPPAFVVYYGAALFLNDYIDAVSPHDFCTFVDGFMQTIPWGPDLPSLEYLAIRRGVQHEGSNIILGQHTSQNKEKTFIDFYPDAFFGSLPTYSTSAGAGNATDSLTIKLSNAANVLLTRKDIENLLLHKDEIATSYQRLTGKTLNFNIRYIKFGADIEVDGVKQHGYEVYIDAFNGLIDDALKIYPYYATQLNGLHVENGQLVDGPYSGIDVDSRIPFIGVIKAADPTFQGVGINWLSYVSAHEYGHHATLSDFMDASEDGVFAGGFRARSGLSMTQRYSAAAISNYLAARAPRLTIERTTVTGEASPSGNFFRWLENGVPEQVADIFGAKYLATNFLNPNDPNFPFRSLKRRVARVASEMPALAAERHVTLSDLFIENAWDTWSVTISPSLQGQAMTYTVGSDGHVQAGSLSAVSDSSVRSLMRDGQGHQVFFDAQGKAIIQKWDDDAPVMVTSRSIVDRPGHMRHTVVFNRDGSPIVPNDASAQAITNAASRISGFTDSIFRQYVLNGFGNDLTIAVGQRALQSNFLIQGYSNYAPLHDTYLNSLRTIRSLFINAFSRQESPATSGSSAIANAVLNFGTSGISDRAAMQLFFNTHRTNSLRQGVKHVFGTSGSYFFFNADGHDVTLTANPVFKDVPGLEDETVAYQIGQIFTYGPNGHNAPLQLLTTAREEVLLATSGNGFATSANRQTVIANSDVTHAKADFSAFLQTKTNVLSSLGITLTNNSIRPELRDGSLTVQSMLGRFAVNPIEDFSTFDIKNTPNDLSDDISFLKQTAIERIFDLSQVTFATPNLTTEQKLQRLTLFLVFNNLILLNDVNFNPATLTSDNVKSLRGYYGAFIANRTGSDYANARALFTLNDNSIKSHLTYLLSAPVDHMDLWTGTPAQGSVSIGRLNVLLGVVGYSITTNAVHNIINPFNIHLSFGPSDDIISALRSRQEEGYNQFFSDYTFDPAEAINRDWLQITYTVPQTQLENLPPFVSGLSEANSGFEYYLDGSSTIRYLNSMIDATALGNAVIQVTTAHPEIASPGLAVANSYGGSSGSNHLAPNFLGQTKTEANGFFKDDFMRRVLSWEVYDEHGHSVVDSSITIKDLNGQPVTSRARAIWIAMLRNRGVGDRTLTGIWRSPVRDATYLWGYLHNTTANAAVRFIRFTDTATNEFRYLPVHVGDNNLHYYESRETGHEQVRTLADDGYLSWASDYAPMGGYADNVLLLSGHSYTVKFVDENRQEIAGADEFTLGSRRFIGENGKPEGQAPLFIRRDAQTNLELFHIQDQFNG